jgi:predicted Zn-dependent protease
MVRCGWIVVLSLLASAGCMSEEPTALVPSDPFHPPRATPPARTSFAPPSTAAAARVDTLARKILQANPQAGVRPWFRTIGAPQPEIFHVSTGEIDITEGLVNQCKTDDELAAVLCHELGKMVAEREVLAGSRRPDRTPPPEVRVGNDYPGATSSADLTRLAELGKFEKEHPRRPVPVQPPDPQVLARRYLTKAGFEEKTLDAVAPLLQAAAANTTFEKQLAPRTP